MENLLPKGSPQEAADPLLLEHTRALSSTALLTKEGVTSPDKVFALEHEQQGLEEQLQEPELEEEAAEPSLAAFAEFIAVGQSSASNMKPEALLEAAAFLFGQALAISGVPSAGAGFFKHDKSTKGARIGTLRSIFKGHRLWSEENFGTALACLEELRLLVPFAWGNDFCEVPAAVAAPYCLRWRARSNGGSNAGIPASGTDWPGLMFTRAHVGCHWGCDPVPDVAHRRLMYSAAGFVVRATGTGIVDMPLQGLLLPIGLVSPAAWIDGLGRLNVSALRFVCCKLMLQLGRGPGVSAAELAQQAGLLEQCEVALLLDKLAAGGLVEIREGPANLGEAAAAVSSQSLAAGPVYFSRLLRKQAQSE